jgi:hypothetical protein
METCIISCKNWRARYFFCGQTVVCSDSGNSLWLAIIAVVTLLMTEQFWEGAKSWANGGYKIAEQIDITSGTATEA